MLVLVCTTFCLFIPVEVDDTWVAEPRVWWQFAAKPGMKNLIEHFWEFSVLQLRKSQRLLTETRSRNST